MAISTSNIVRECYDKLMNKSSFLSGLINDKQKNIAEYLTGWDDLNILFKSMGKTWGFISGIWTSKSERKHHQTKCTL